MKRLIWVCILVLCFRVNTQGQTLSEDAKDYQAFTSLKQELLARPSVVSTGSDSINPDTWLMPFQGGISNPFVLKTWQLELAHYFIAQGKWEEAQEILSHIMSFQKDPVIYPQALKLAIEIELHNRNKNKALRIYGDLVSQFENPDPDLEVWKRIQKYFGNRLSIIDCFGDSSTYLGYIQNLAKKGRQDEVYEHGRKFVFLYPQSKYLGEISFWVGKTYYDKGFYVPAIMAFERAQDLSNNPAILSESYYLSGKSWMALQSPRKAYPQFLQGAKLFRSMQYAPFCLYELCKLLRQYGPNRDYVYYTKLFVQRYPHHEALRAMQWEDEWADFSAASGQESPQRVYEQFTHEIIPDSVLSNKLLQFYRAYFGPQLDQLSSNIRQLPVSYYAYNVLSHFFADTMTSDSQSVADKFIALAQSGSEKMALNGLAYEQFMKQKGLSEVNLNYLYAYVVMVLKRSHYDNVLWVLKQKLDPESVTYGKIPSFLTKLFYPKLYWQLITAHASRYQIDPYLVLAMMREESSFNPYAKSKVGALGLLQVRPNTGHDVAFRMGMIWKGEDMLYTPETNIKFSVFYLSWLKKQFKGNMIYAVAAYNAGPEAVRKWMLSSKTPDFEEFVSKISYPETQQYVRRVMNSYVIYKILYSE